MKFSKKGAKMTAAGRSLGYLALLGTSAACGGQSSGSPARPVRAEAKTIEAAGMRYVAATNRGDLETLAALYTDDAMLLPPDHAPIQGRNAIVDFWRHSTDQDLATITLRVDVQGNLGYLVGRYTLPATPQAPADSGKYLLCLRRQRDGAWKVTADIWNSSVTTDSTGTEPDSDKAGEEEQPPRWPVS